MAKEKKNRFWYSERQASLDDDVWDKNRQFTFVKTPEGYKLYSEWCSIKGTRCNWEDAELVYETDDDPEVIVHNGVSGLIADLQKQLSEKEKEIERLKKYDEYRFEMPYPKVKILGKTLEDIQEIIDKWLEQGGENKIEFAVAELERVKDWLELKYFDKEQINYLANAIDQQIKELKGEK